MNGDEELEKEFQLKINGYLNKIDKSINDFRFNVTIALFYEIYKVFRHYLDKKIFLWCYLFLYLSQLI